MQMLSSYVVASPIFSEDNAPLLVILATRTGAGFELPLSIWQVLRSGAFEKLNAKTRTELSEAEILVPQAKDELAVVLSRNREAIRTNTHLNYVIQPTAHCQLGCGYCGQKHERRNLSTENETAILRDVRDRLDAGKFSELNLCWFGAEPLSGLVQMRSLTPQLRRVAEERNVEYRASIITNGLAMSRKIGAELEIARRLLARHGKTHTSNS